MKENNGNGASTNKPLEPEQFRKMFIGGLTVNVTDEMLREYYGQWGEILDCIVMKDPQTKKSRGFGFVSFSSQEEVDKAMAARPHMIDGKTLDPKRAVPREHAGKTESNVSTKRLYVSGVREEHTEEVFTDYFSGFGNVEKAEIMRDKSTGKPRGFAFVSFDDYDPVDKCVLMRSHMIKGYRCDVKKALSKEEIGRGQQSDKDRAFRGDRSRGNTRGGQSSGYGGPGGPPPWGPPSSAGSGGGAWSGSGSGWGGQGSGYGGSGGYGGGGSGYGGGGKLEPTSTNTGWGGGSGGGGDSSWNSGPTGGSWGGPSSGWQQQQQQTTWGPPGQGSGWSHGGGGGGGGGSWGQGGSSQGGKNY